MADRCTFDQNDQCQTHAAGLEVWDKRCVQGLLERCLEIDQTLTSMHIADLYEAINDVA